MLDTNVVSDFLKGHPQILSRFAQHAPGDLAISAVTVMEIEYGLAGQPAARQRYGEVWAALQEELEVLGYDPPDAVATATLRQQLRQRGTPIGPYDLQLAGTALARGLVMVTNNLGEFSRVDGLNCEDWRSTR